ncbi:competence protein ComEC [Phenylobacterium sp. Root77]|nr:competence protein ComEC [Phenylobacterium sp. Root1277]KQW94479.1 competence protein ComEC [Phenylobacterium sp. Root1290]KRC44173.1 competence protein ComEC [Phenylobacterium sp. Root77]
MGAAPLNTPFPLRPSLRRIAAWFADQASVQTISLWTPVAFGSGAAMYLALPAEPLALVAWAVLGLAGLMLLAAARMNLGRPAVVCLVLTAFALGGFAAAKLRTQSVRAPIAPAGGGVRAIEGFVVDVASPGQGGPRLLVAPIRISGLEPQATPIRIRITLRDDDALPAPGTAISVKGMINAPPPPASPGSYDFARDAFFDGVGGVGFALTPIASTQADPPPWRLALEMKVNAVRWALAKRIVAEMGVESGGLAAAMTTGHEAFVPKEQVEDLRASGLAHIISISGLHMAIVGGFTFAAVRLGVAAWPWAALRVSSKKVAAAAGLLAVILYLVISGAPAPAERAAITAGAAFLAILVDRRAISLHTLAIAALVILAMQPEAVAAPGFQMSFAATAALVALAEAWPRPAKEINTPWPIRTVQAVGVWTVASIGASFVAGLATGPFAMQHFNRVSTFGLVANLLTAPISSFLMMPALAIGAVLAPLGLGAVPLAAADVAIDTMNMVASWVAGMPGSQRIFASAPAWTLPAAFIGILWLCLWKGPLRWLGLPLALAVWLTPRPPAPDAWISADGATVAVRRGDEAVLLRPDAKLFAAELWARRRGLVVAMPEARGGGYDCDRWSCAPLKDSADPRIAAIFTRRVSTIQKKQPLFCAWAEVVVIRGQAAPCPTALTLTEQDFARGGSAELYREASGWRIVWAQDLRGQRPWSR